MHGDLEALRAFVTAPSTFAHQADDTVLLHVTHSNLRAQFMEIRFSLSCSVEDMKRKLSSHCGSSVSAMSLQLQDEHGNVVATLTDDGRLLGYYSPQNGYTVHISDADPYSASAGGWLEDVSKVPKYVMSDADYSKRENTYRKYKEAKLAQDPTWTLERELATRQGRDPNQEVGADFSEEAAACISIGDRCEVSPGGRRGTVRYKGLVKGLPDGTWIGIEYDEPLGKNDGIINGKRYFECPCDHGAFVRGGNVCVGEFSEVSILESDDEV